MFQRVLIANRGEIAVRLTQAVQELGMTAIAIFAEPDRHAHHVACADEAYGLNGITAGETYLQIDAILRIAKQHNIDAIHPGYGFLSENADFAQACEDAGITFVGPTPQVIATMGDKLIAKKMMTDAGVPVAAGWSGDVAEGADAAAAEIGYPIMVKAAAGGGGKGMRVVTDPADLQASIESAQRESGAAFGDSRVFIEKCIQRPRHIEFQIFGDHHGNVVHLLERECSIQRRHQKIVEESPSPFLSDDLREEMGAAAVKAARAIGYTNAGTVEFMVDAAGDFYFLEVNTRLQVEHPVTEMTLGLDLAKVQFSVAAGEPLPFSQDSLSSRGHALECRIYAEDPSHHFVPSVGTIHEYIVPSGPNVRVDSGVQRGSEVSVHFDPMLSKLIVWGETREVALKRAAWALDRFVVLGVTTNIEFLRNLIEQPEFMAGNLNTGFLDEIEVAPVRPARFELEALVVAALTRGQNGAQQGGRVDRALTNASPWLPSHAWRNV